jgi:hypothetical protein
VDWEFSAADHKARFLRLFGTIPPGSIYYLRASRALHEEAERINRLIDREKIGYVICDSIAFACGGAPESAEIATRYFDAIRGFRVGSLHIAHISKAEDGDQKPFGSAFWSNGARSTWFVQRAKDTESEDQVLLALHHRKCNTSRLLPPMGLRITFGQERTFIEPADVASGESVELSEKLPIRQRIAHVLQSGGPKTQAELSEALLGLDPSAIRSTMSRMRLVRNSAGSGGQATYSLPDDSSDDNSGY